MRILISFSSAASLYISSLLLDLVEGIIENRDPNPRRLFLVGAARILLSLGQWASHEILYVSTLILPVLSFTEHAENNLRGFFGSESAGICLHTKSVVGC